MEKTAKKRYIQIQMRVFSFVLLFAVLCAGGVCAENLSEWLVPLREAVYEQRLSADGVQPVYEAAKAAAAAHLSGDALDLALSRCEYLMGRVLQYDKRDNDARPHYQEGMRLAEKVLAANRNNSAGAWLELAQNLSQLCSLGPWTYTMANGLNVEKYAKSALALDSRNAAAQYLVAARWVFAPSPFSDHRKGIRMMEAILTEGDMDKDDRFNVYSAIGYAYIQQRKNADARPWLQRALEIYPSNKYVRELLDSAR